MKKRWLAGYGSFLDWYIVKNTEENAAAYRDHDGSEYDTFAEAKAALVKIVKEKIDDDKRALAFIRKRRKNEG